MELSIIPECYVDTNLIETLVPPVKRYNHQKSCNNVARHMQTKLKDSFALGIIDRDKDEIKYIEEFDLISDKTSLKLYRHKDTNKHHYFIVIVPAMEQWIIDSAKSSGIRLSTYGLPEDLKELLKRTKKITSKNDQDLKKLFKELLHKKAENAVRLAKWVQYLKEKNYQADINYLKTI